MEQEVREIKLKENDELNRYIDEFNNDIKLSLANIREKALMVSSIRGKWLSYLFKERENLARLKDLKALALKKKMEESKNDSVLKLKTEEAIVKNDETMQKLAKLEKITNSNLDYIERALSILQDFGFSIKNTIEVLKLEKM